MRRLFKDGAAELVDRVSGYFGDTLGIDVGESKIIKPITESVMGYLRTFELPSPREYGKTQKFVFPSNLEGRISALTSSNTPAITHPFAKITFYTWQSQSRDIIRRLEAFKPQETITENTQAVETPKENVSIISQIFITIPESSLIENFSHQWSDSLDWTLGTTALLSLGTHLAIDSAIRHKSLTTLAPFLQKSGETFFAAAGFKINDLQAQSYRNLDLRSFSYLFNLIPKNAEETKMIEDIIRHIKDVTTPSYEGAFIEYPAICDVAIYGGIGKLLYQTMLSGVQKFDISYAPDGYMRTFKDGSPARYTISLDIRELRRMDKKLIDNYTSGI